MTDEDDARLFAEGVAQYAAGRSGQAVELLRRAIALNDRQPRYHLSFGAALRASGQLDAAIAAYGAGLRLSQDSAELHFNLGNALLQQGDRDGARQSFLRALCVRPDLAEAYGNYALLQPLPAVTLSASRSAMRLKPDSVTFVLAHASGLTQLKRGGEAGDMLRAVIALAPAAAEAYARLADLAKDETNPDDFQHYYHRALALGPWSAELHNNFGTALQEIVGPTEAIPLYRRATLLLPGNGGFYSNRGTALTALGDFPAAAIDLERAVRLQPGNGVFWGNLAVVRRFTAADPLLAQLASLARSAAPADQVAMHFALAKAYDDCGAWDQAMSHMGAGNHLRRAAFDYDEAATLAQLRQIEALYSAPALDRLAGRGFRSALPIFIIGMPRSGTTLVEQCLASHPEIFGAGEILWIERLACRLAFPSLPDIDWAATGRDYIHHLSRLAPAARRITDKMPFNFLYVGLIRTLLPDAKFIHVRRDPVDTCLSCYSKFFQGEQPAFSYDLGELGRYYRAYQRLMAHWRRVLPAGVMIEIDYEALIADLPGEIGRVLAQCGLSWDPACADFADNRRVVRTASAVQVRRPLYRSAIGRSQAYRAYLAPLLAGLATDPS